MNQPRVRSRGRGGSARPTADPGSALKLVQSRVPVDVWRTLEAEATADRRSLANHIRGILEDHVRAAREHAADQKEHS